MRRWSARIMIGLVGAAFLFLAWSLVYAVVVGWRFDPRLPSEGAARWALLQSLNADYSWQVLFRSADHFSRRMLFPPTQAETAIRGAIALSVVLAAGLGLAIAAHVLRPLKPYGEARFGSILDAERRKLTTRRGLVLGRLAGATITSDEPGHVLVVGPTRSGKGQSFIGPNGLLWNGSAVVFDPKKENVAIFGAYRAAAGDKVYLFNPGELRSHRYNPLDFIRRDETMPTDALVVAGFIVPDTPGEVWGKSARLLLAAMIGYVLTSPLCEGARHLRSVARMLVSGKDISAHLKSIVATEGERLPSWVGVQPQHRAQPLEQPAGRGRHRDVRLRHPGAEEEADVDLHRLLGRPARRLPPAAQHPRPADPRRADDGAAEEGRAASGSSAHR